MNFNLQDQQLLNIIDTRINEALSKYLPVDRIATVISVGSGDALFHLPTDPDGTNITVLNPNEISLEIGDHVLIHYSSATQLGNAYILFRKTINFNNIYVDYATGTDAFGIDSSGNKYGSSSAPFKTLQYAV